MLIRTLALAALMTSPLVFAHETERGDSRKLSEPSDCERGFTNVRGYLHDPTANKAFDDPMRGIDGKVTDSANLDIPAMLSAYARDAYLSHERDGKAYFVQPRERALIELADFEKEIPKRDRKYLRSLESSGFFATHDEDFEAVLALCASILRYGRTSEGHIVRDSQGTPVEIPSWLTPNVRRLFLRMHVHPERYVHSTEAWMPLPKGGRRLVGGLITTMINGVPTGETMCFDRRVTKNLGKLPFFALLKHLRERGHPELDVQMLQKGGLPDRWGAFKISREHHRQRRERHEALGLGW